MSLSDKPLKQILEDYVEETRRRHETDMELLQYLSGALTVPADVSDGFEAVLAHLQDVKHWAPAPLNRDVLDPSPLEETENNDEVPF